MVLLHELSVQLLEYKPGLRIRIRIRLMRIRIRIQHFRLNADPDSIRIQGFDNQKLKKKCTVEKKTRGAQIVGGRHVVLLHVVSVQLLEYKPGTLWIRIRVTVQIWIRIRITVKIWIRIRTDRWRSARGSSPCSQRTASRIQTRAEDPHPCYQCFGSVFNFDTDPDPRF
jgi:hypothetical protein